MTRQHTHQGGENQISDYFQPAGETETRKRKKNKRFGDNLLLKEENSLRLYYQNINGIKASEFNIYWQTAMRVMKDRQMEIAGFSETNVDWNRWRTK